MWEMGVVGWGRVMGTTVIEQQLTSVAKKRERFRDTQWEEVYMRTEAEIRTM